MKKVLLVVSALTFLLVLALALRAERIVLVATKNLDVVAGHSPQASGVVTAKLAPGERASVVACEDVKPDVYPKVRLTSGAEGYILSSGYQLVRTRAGFFDSSPVVFSCYGFFQPISKTQE